MKRSIEKILQAQQSSDGDGVKLLRIFPQPGIEQIDPFLLMDHFGSDNTDDFKGGFPMHPHRGIETVTYMLKGRVKHRDSTGREGSIEAGDVQWMSAGRGIMHEEMPQPDDGELDGIQIWVNLPASEKMKKPEYQEFPASKITKFAINQHDIRLISGELLGYKGSVSNISTLPIYADITLASEPLTMALPAQHNAFIYVVSGDLQILNDSGDSKNLANQQLAVLSHGDSLSLSSDNRARLILGAGKPINEPIARGGPFVMNTREEILQTFAELQAGNFPPK